MGKRKEILERVLQASNKEELMAAYNEWAEGYDQDLTDELAYVAPLKASNLLHNYLQNYSYKLLDAGCGTGLVGECLQNLGYENIDGLDYSESMLRQAEEKNIYGKLIQADLTVSLTITDNLYDAIICVGTFTCGHVGPEAFYELIRIVKPGGYICFTVRDQAWEDDGYNDVLKSITQRGKWKLTDEMTSDYIQQEGSLCKICLYEVLTA